MHCAARRMPQLEDMYKAAADADEKARLLNALAYAGPGGNIHSTLALALSADVRAQVRRSGRPAGGGCERRGGGRLAGWLVGSWWT